MKAFYNTLAFLIIVFLLVPVGMYAAILSFIEVIRIFPSKVFNLFDNI